MTEIELQHIDQTLKQILAAIEKLTQAITPPPPPARPRPSAVETRTAPPRARPRAGRMKVSENED
ncbi:hypothetical protein ABTZ93_05035 [Streptomyces sp. NPDC097941]|uniref:hypothetical protein n=1 Tax=Streptomyces sp. NPDC097941 TaxID=3155685 RepID=UPI00331EAD94